MRGKRVRMIAVVTVAAVAAALWAGAATARSKPMKISYSPLTAVGVGPSGPPTAQIDVQPYCCPSTAVVVTPTAGPVGEDDFQWVNLGLTTPLALQTGASETQKLRITRVNVCYEVNAAESGTTYISQTRLTNMTTPDSAGVVLDNGTNRTGPGPSCYSVKTDVTPTGAVTLALKVVFGSERDEIRVGAVRLTYKP